MNTLSERSNGSRLGERIKLNHVDVAVVDDPVDAEFVEFDEEDELDSAHDQEILKLPVVWPFVSVENALLLKSRSATPHATQRSRTVTVTDDPPLICAVICLLQAGLLFGLDVAPG